MKRFSAGSLALLLATLTPCRADDKATPKAAALGRPVAMTPAEEAKAPGVASLGRPTATGQGVIPARVLARDGDDPFRSPLVRTSRNEPPATLQRTQGIGQAKPMPVGTPLGANVIAASPAGDDANVVPAPESETIIPAPRPVATQSTVIAGNGCDACPPVCETCTGKCCNHVDPFWMRGEYLLWTIKNSGFPPIVTTSPAASLGVLGQPGTRVLFGNSIDNEERSGGRFTIGGWINESETIGLETTFFFLGSRAVRYNAASDGAPLLARPFFNVVTGTEDSELIANPALPNLPPLTGAVGANLTSRMWGIEGNALFNLWCRNSCRFDLLAGLRYMQLNEGLGIGESLFVPAGAPMLAGTGFNVTDNFDTRNLFYGEQIGGRLFLNWNRWDLEFVGKVAIGINHQVVDINGRTVIVAPGAAPVVSQGGLLALPTNIGHYDRDRFGVIPELGVNLGYQLTPHWRALVGYTFLYWNSVARPGDQINRSINPTQLPPGVLAGPAQPSYVFRGTDFWAQGVNLGLQLSF